MLVEPDRVGSGLGAGWWGLHVGQVLCIPQVSQHVLQLGPVWSCLTKQVNSVSKQTHSDGEREKKYENNTIYHYKAVSVS